MDGEISIRAHYERFPATIKGAFVLRGAGRDPQQVRIEDARVIELSGTGSQSDRPGTRSRSRWRRNLDLFVPFELPVTELGAGWYASSAMWRSTVRRTWSVPGDGSRAWPRRDRPPWPGARRQEAGTVAGDTVAIDQIDVPDDSIRIGFAATEGTDA